MIAVEEAFRTVLENLFIPGDMSVAVEDAVGQVLAEPVYADRPFPPFNRVSMDGIAICYEEWRRGRRAYAIEGSQAAGKPQTVLQDTAACWEVMTGAMLPAGCDTVIRYEDVDIKEGQAVVKVDNLQQGQSVHPEGVDVHQNDVILAAGQKLSPSEIAILASVGKDRVLVKRPPRIAVVSTGDELVGIGEIPKAWQIRASNAYAIRAALRESGCPSGCFHLRDNQPELKEGLERIIQSHDVLILSGGVSMGKHDYVPRMLEEAGIRKVFHQVSQRPGKPLWFGRSENRIAFALPGNPVSTFMCFYKYIKPWLAASMGAPIPPSTAVLASDVSFQPALTYFVQVAVSNDGGKLVATPVPGGGSGDFANLTQVDGFLELPLEKSNFRAGEVFPFIPFRH